MRFWNRLTDPTIPGARSRSVSRANSPTNFGLRPMFSVPSEEVPPVTETMARESKLDELTPIDTGPGSQFREDLIKPEVGIPVVLTYSTDNVSGTPTDAEFTAAFGTQEPGFIAMVIDAAAAGQVYIVVKSLSNLWWYEALTKAL